MSAFVWVINNFSLKRGFPQKMYGVSLPHEVEPELPGRQLDGIPNDGSVSTREKASLATWLLAATAVVSIIFPSGVNVPDYINQSPSFS